MTRPSTSGSRLQSAAPFLLVPDVFSTAEYYRDALGFEFEQFWGEPPRFVMVRRDGITIMLRSHADLGADVARPNHARVPHSFDAYVWVEDVDALHAELAQRGARVLYPPCDQPHDCREFEIEDPNGYRICFGQDLLA